MEQHDIKAITIAKKTGLHKTVYLKALSGKIESYETLRRIERVLEEIVASSPNSETIDTMLLAKKKLVTTFEEDEIRRVREKMLKNSFSQIPVVGADGSIRGLVTERSLLDSAAAYSVKQALSQITRCSPLLRKSKMHGR